ncbi:MAG TPA: carbon storage regulator [Pirellulales bacterium]|jgi:carbon storage regulator
MLVLSRKQSERIRLGRDIVVTVVRVAGDKVRLGIEAPSDVLVLRDELETHGGSVEIPNDEIQFTPKITSASKAVLS